MKVVYFGTPAFAAKIFADLVREGIDIVAVVTKPDKPQGRSSKLIPTHVKAKAQELLPQIPVYQPEHCSTPEFIKILKKHPADLYVVVAYGEIIKQEVLDLPKYCCINVHASLLPQYRGAAPMQRALMNGEKETGISVIRLVRKMDAGDILAIESLPVPDDMTFPELEDKLCELGSKVLLKVIADFRNGTATFQPQDHNAATFAAKITPEECEIDWSRPAKDLHNMIRAVTPHPGAFCHFTIRGVKKRVKLVRTRVADAVIPERQLQSPTKETLLIGCGGGSALEVVELQVEGKPLMKIADFLRGCPATALSIE